MQWYLQNIITVYLFTIHGRVMHAELYVQERTDWSIEYSIVSLTL